MVDELRFPFMAKIKVAEDSELLFPIFNQVVAERRRFCDNVMQFAPVCRGDVLLVEIEAHALHIFTCESAKVHEVVRNINELPLAEINDIDFLASDPSRGLRGF